MDQREDKRRLRRRILTARDALPQAEIAQRSLALFERLTTLSEYQHATTVHLYASFGTEVDTTPILGDLWTRGCRAVLPRVAPGRQLENCVVRSWDDLAPGFRDIPEPCPTCPAAPPFDIDLVLVPGVAFDRQGGRLGYGGGYYDRFLAACPAPRVALTFALQLVDRVVREPHDLEVHVIVTEDEVIRVADPLALARQTD